MSEAQVEWDLAQGPKQSITELLQNPRGRILELPELSSFELSLPPSPSTPLPPRATLNINHFTQYIRRYAPLHADLPSSTPASPKNLLLSSVPSLYYDSPYAPHTNPHLAALQPTCGPPSSPLDPIQVASLRASLIAHQSALQTALHARLTASSPQITAALLQLTTLRATLQTTAHSLHTANLNTSSLLPLLKTPLQLTTLLRQHHKNLLHLHTTLSQLKLLQTAPAKVTALLTASAYAPAIETLHSAKAILAIPTLAPLLALAPARARLAQAAEHIDAALRENFRTALSAPPAPDRHPVLQDIVALVNQTNRLPLLRAFFLREIRDQVATDLPSVTTLPAAANTVLHAADRAGTLLAITGGDDADDAARFGRALEELLASAADRFLAVSTRSTHQFVIVTRSVAAETCFDELKAALRFSDDVRALEDVACQLEGMFGDGRRGGVLRAKISERQIAFVGAFHRAHVEVLNNAVRGDSWQEVRVGEGVLRLLAAVVGEEPPGEGAVVVGGEPFKTVSCGLRYVRSICAYTLLAEKAPGLASEIARRGTELSRLFNSLVGKAILGAAALQWSALRSITARHLSLASRTVAMAAALAERVNLPLANALSEAQAGVILPLIQKSEKDLRQHHGQLLAKILAIMMDRLDAHERVLKSLPWEKMGEMQRFDVPSAYITTLVKEATVLHRILWSILPRTEVFDIFQRVCAAYGTHLAEAYGSLDGGKKWVRSRVAEDVTCLHERLVALDVFKSNPEALKPVVKLYNRFAKEYLEEEETKGAMNEEQQNAAVARNFVTQRVDPKKQQAKASVPVNNSGISESNTTAPVTGSDRKDRLDSANVAIEEGQSTVEQKEETQTQPSQELEESQTQTSQEIEETQTQASQTVGPAIFSSISDLETKEEPRSQVHSKDKLIPKEISNSVVSQHGNEVAQQSEEKKQTFETPVHINGPSASNSETTVVSPSHTRKNLEPESLKASSNVVCEQSDASKTRGEEEASQGDGPAVISSILETKGESDETDANGSISEEPPLTIASEQDDAVVKEHEETEKQMSPTATTVNDANVREQEEEEKQIPPASTSVIHVADVRGEKPEEQTASTISSTVASFSSPHINGSKTKVEAITESTADILVSTETSRDASKEANEANDEEGE